MKSRYWRPEGFDRPQGTELDFDDHDRDTRNVPPPRWAVVLGSTVAALCWAILMLLMTLTCLLLGWLCVFVASRIF